MQSSSREDHIDPRLHEIATELSHWGTQQQQQQQQQQQSMSHSADNINVVIDRQSFINTRNALTNAFVGLSGAIDEAVKAYVNHTNAVLDGIGGSALDVSGLLQPFAGITQINNVAQIAQQAILQNGNGFIGQSGVQLNPDGTKKKRAYKPRDPNAPKRPLTAYFRYLQEQRPLIQVEIAQQGPNPDGGKAGDISKIATERWNRLPKDQQAPYRKAYEKEMHKYYADVKAYKAAGGQVDEDVEEDEAAAVSAQPLAGVAREDDEDVDESDGDDDDDDESSDDGSDNEIKPAPKKIKAGADPVAPAHQFGNLDHDPIMPAPVAPSMTSTLRRKGDGMDENREKRKRDRKGMAHREADDAVAASAQLQVFEPSRPGVASSLEKSKKEKKKKRKSEAAAAAAATAVV